jgi:hypothetical protein
MLESLLHSAGVGASSTPTFAEEVMWVVVSGLSEPPTLSTIIVGQKELPLHRDLI